MTKDDILALLSQEKAYLQKTYLGLIILEIFRYYLKEVLYKDENNTFPNI